MNEGYKVLRNIITASALVAGLISPVASSASGIEWCQADAHAPKENLGHCRPTQRECLTTIPSSDKTTICYPFAAK